MVGYGGWMLKTADGGFSRTKLTSGTYRSLCSVRFLDSETGWVVGERGTVLSATNGGATPYGGITSVDQKQVDGVPTKFVLLQNYTSPLNPATKIQFTIVNVYDVLGREVATLVNGMKEPETYTVEFDARLPGGQTSNLGSGVYLYCLTAGSFVQTRKLLLLR